MKVFKINNYRYVIANDIREAIDIYMDYEKFPGDFLCNITSIIEVID